MNKLIKTTIIFAAFQLAIAFDCNLPDRCFIQPVKYGITEFDYEKRPIEVDIKEIKCEPDRGFQFRFVENDFMANGSDCIINNEIYSEIISFESKKKL